MNLNDSKITLINTPKKHPGTEHANPGGRVFGRRPAGAGRRLQAPFERDAKHRGLLRFTKVH